MKTALPFISVIIPVYNVESFIQRCFWSVVSQTYRNYECIFVDDCGTDRSLEILQQLIASYKGDIPLKLIHHERNLGLSAARNSGMKIATGVFFYFVDSDDFIFPDALKSLTGEVQEDKYDVICGRFLIMKNGKIILSKIGEKILEADIKCFHKKLSYIMSCSSTACNHLYRKSFLENNGIRFCEGHLHEDNLFNAEIFLHNPRILETKHISYVYVIRKNSITTSLNHKHFEEEINNVKLLKEILIKNCIMNAPDSIRLIVQRSLRLLIIARDHEKKEFINALRFVRSSRFTWNEWTAIPLRHKLLYTVKLMPEKIALLYALFFVLIYRAFIWRREI